MIISPKILLIDSNSYFRLAKSLHPLLGIPICKNKYRIFILKECEQEYSKSLGLQNKFEWVKENEYVENRKQIVKTNITTKNAINNNIQFIKYFARDNYMAVSDVDIRYIATALELDCILITDDSDMMKVAFEFEIKVMKSIELLKLMLDFNHITIEKVVEIISYWRYSKDVPKNCKEDFEKLFNIKY